MRYIVTKESTIPGKILRDAYSSLESTQVDQRTSTNSDAQLNYNLNNITTLKFLMQINCEVAFWIQARKLE